MATSRTTDSRGLPLPAGVIWDIGTHAYWVRADFYAERIGSRWELTDTEDASVRRYRSEAAVIKALAALV